MINHILDWEKQENHENEDKDSCMSAAQQEESAAAENAEEETAAVDAQQLARLARMGENLQLVLRMASMDMLREEDGGYVMNANGISLRMPDAKTLFDAYLVLEGLYGDDFSELDRVLEAPWAKEVIDMVLSPEQYVKAWRSLRMRVITQALPMLRKYSEESRMERDSKYFTLLSLRICDKVIDILSQSDDATQK